MFFDILYYLIIEVNLENALFDDQITVKVMKTMLVFHKIHWKDTGPLLQMVDCEIHKNDPPQNDF